jgi:hypothetical protein
MSIVSLSNLPINDETIEDCWFITHWTFPCGLLFIHQEVSLSIKALQMRTSVASSWNPHPHLSKLKQQIRTLQQSNKFSSHNGNKFMS